MSKCFVPGCKTGYASCDVKASLFKPPVDSVELDKWRRAIPRADRTLSNKDRVCALHFSPDCLQYAYAGNTQSDVCNLLRERPKLVAGSVPHIFPNLPHYLSRPVSRKRTVIDRSGTVAKKRKMSRAEGVSTYVSEVEGAFLQLCQNSKSVCPESWCRTFNDNYVCFCKLNVVSDQAHISVSVSISKALDVIAYCEGSVVKLPFSVNIHTKDDVHDLLLKIEKLNPCVGNPDAHLVESVQKSRVGFKDNCGVWRHKHCTRLISDGTRCSGCRKLRRILQTSAAKKKMHSSKRQSWRLRSRTVHRLRNRIHTSKLLVAHLKAKLNTVSTSKLRSLIADLPHGQRLIVEHFMHQRRVKSPRGMRYDHKWILSCILLRIKSPKAYKHLRDGCLLPLPSRATLQRYMEVIRAEVGMLTILSSKVSSASERHGILMFDEIKLRQGITFNVKAMEFEGLVDLGEFASSKNAVSVPADTGLVFLYRPFLGSWMQTVGMFLSHGPTSSATLAKIILKLVFALEAHGLLV